MQNHKRDINNEKAMELSGYAVCTVELDDSACVAPYRY
jgi:hypothetical protein